MTVKRWIGGSRGKINERTDRDGQLRRDVSDKQEMVPTNTGKKLAAKTQKMYLKSPYVVK